jgi:plastocyanin
MRSECEHPRSGRVPLWAPAGLLAAFALLALAVGAYAMLRRPGRTARPAASPAPAAVAVRGVVRLRAGDAVPPRPAPAAKPCETGESRPPRPPAVDPETRGIAAALVWIVDPPAALRGAAPPAGTRAVLDQRGCEFEPAAQVVRAGAELLVRNGDPVLHNIHARIEGGRALFNIGMAPGNPELPVVLRPAGLVRVRCDVHPWMGAAILVVDHPFAAATGARGEFSFPAPPPGRYRLRVWHERLGEREVALEVGPEGAELALELPGR